MKNLSGWIAVSVVSMLPWLPGVGAAQAQDVSCSVAVNSTNWNIDFGIYSGATLNAAAPGTLRIQCAGGSGDRVVHLCVGLGAGSGGVSVDDRRLTNGSNSLQYQLYRDAASTQVFGPVQADSAIAYNTLVPAGSLATYNTGITVYGRLFGNQAPGTLGDYQSQFSAAHMEIMWRDYPVNQMPFGCGVLNMTMPNSSNFAVQAVVQSSCAVNVLTHVNFGSITAPSGGTKTASGRIRVQCEGSNITYRVELQDGLWAENPGSPTAVRHMRHATQTDDHYVTYELYQDAQYTLRWGRIANNQHVTGSGLGTHTVRARTTVPSDAVAGNYADTVVVQVEY